jgi:hypothetical protein
MPARRYNCRCGKRRFRDERSALAAADADQSTYGDVITVYRCAGGLAWHLSAHGFTPGALRSTGRRLAFALSEHPEVDLDDFRTRSDRRRWERVERCTEQLTELGLARRGAGAGSLVAVNRAGLLRVVQIGLDAYAEERSRLEKERPGQGSKR